MKQKAMISQPMKGKTEEEIVATRNRAVAELERRGYSVENTLLPDGLYDPENLTEQELARIPLFGLALSLLAMSRCNTVYFCNGWENARGCKIEHDAALAYELEVLYEC